MKPVAPQELEADIARLEVGIRQLRVQYDMFFAGALKREPFELRARIEQLIKRYSQNPPGRYADRFRLNTLVSRFNSLSELWGKRVRSREEGSTRHQSFAESVGIRERLVARCRLQQADADDADLRRLHSRYVDAKRRSGLPEAKLPSYEAFARGVAAQTRRLRDSSGCDSIELRLIESDEAVQIKARPGSRT